MSKRIAGLIFASAAFLLAAGFPHAHAAVDPARPAVEATAKKAVAAVSKKLALRKKASLKKAAPKRAQITLSKIPHRL